MTYQIVLLDGNNISYRVANIATTTTNWLQEQHLLAASSSSFRSCCPKATMNGEEGMSASAPFHIVLPKGNDKRRGGNERKRPISSHVASRDGDDDLRCYVAPMAATIAFCGTWTYHIMSISYYFTRWLQQQASGCGNNICWQQSPCPSYRVA